MIRFYFHPAPNPAKIALLLEEAGPALRSIPLDTSKGYQHAPSFRTINPNGKVPAIVDTEGPGARDAASCPCIAVSMYRADTVRTPRGPPHSPTFKTFNR